MPMPRPVQRDAQRRQGPPALVALQREPGLFFKCKVSPREPKPPENQEIPEPAHAPGPADIPPFADHARQKDQGVPIGPKKYPGQLEPGVGRNKGV